MSRIGERRFRANLTIFEPSTASIEDRNRDRSRTERNDDHVVSTVDYWAHGMRWVRYERTNE